MKRLLIAGLAVLGIAASTMPAFADNAGTVNAHVRVAAPCLTIDPQSVDFGTLPLTPIGPPSGGTATVNAVNCGGSQESILTHGTSATGNGGTVWGLTDNLRTATCPIKNVYEETAASGAGAGANMFLTPDDQHFVDPPAGPFAIYLAVYMPCDGSAGGGETMSFSYVFTATAS